MAGGYLRVISGISVKGSGRRRYEPLRLSSSPSHSATRICSRPSASRWSDIDIGTNKVNRWRSFDARFESLTPREREVTSMVVSGMPNKQISRQLGTSENTVKVHRSRAMEKMQARSLPDLVRMMEQLKDVFEEAA